MDEIVSSPFSHPVLNILIEFEKKLLKKLRKLIDKKRETLKLENLKDSEH